MPLRPALLLLATVALTAAELHPIPTCENCSIYLRGSSLPAEAVRVRYRSGEGPWLEGHRLVASANDPEPRGSLFALQPGTAYQVECRDAQDALIAGAAFTTWPDQVPVGRTVRVAELAPAGGPLRITQGGTAEAWLRVVGDPGQVVDGGDAEESAILVEGAAFVLLDGLTVRGGRRHGIRVHQSHDVRIRACDIAGFGRIGKQDLGKDGKYYDENGRSINNDAGVFVDGSGRMVVERCWIHDPRGHANSWAFAHPEGPNALFVRATGELVVRWNDLVGGDRHRWNDAIEGWGNGKDPGGFNRDCDIHGNLLALGNDDGIELDGPQRNVRFYGNLITATLCGISTAPNLRGPSFVVGNVVAELGDERGVGSAAVKNGGGTTFSRGQTFFYHNTFFGPGNGVTAVGYGEDRERGMFLGTTRNNLFAVAGSGIRDQHMPASAADYDYDLFAMPWGRPGVYDCVRATEAHGMCAPHGLRNAPGWDFRPGPGSAAVGAAAPIPGFAHLAPGGRADIGALASSAAGGVPVRPGGLLASPARVVFAGSVERTCATPVTVMVTSGGAGGRFQAVRSADSGWMRVEPDSGVLEPGRPLELRVSLERSVLTLDGKVTGVLLVRLEDGLSVPVVVSAQVCGHDLRVAAEAETLEGADGFVQQEDAGASGVRFLVFSGVTERKPGPAGITLPFTVPADGRYFVSCRVRCPTPVIEHDSLFLAVDDQEPVASHLNGSTAWQWVECPAGPHLALQLAAGAHRLRILPRENLALDAVQIRSGPLPLDGRDAVLAPAAR